MTNEEINNLIENYWAKEWPLSEDKKSYRFPDFECRVDPISSSILYSLIRHFKPQTCLEIGSWKGGCTFLILSALLKNELPFIFMASEILPDMQQETARNCLLLTQHSPMVLGDITKTNLILPYGLDFVFVDTNHDRETTEWIVKNVWPKLSQRAFWGMHDWAVWEENGKLLGKGVGGIGGTKETEYLLELYKENKFPFEKLYWTYKNPGGEETGFWFKK